MDLGRILHEFIHVLGFFHMHTSAVRDEYVSWWKLLFSFEINCKLIKIHYPSDRHSMGKCCNACVSEIFYICFHENFCKLFTLWIKQTFYSLDTELKTLWFTRLTFLCMELPMTTSPSPTTRQPHSRKMATQPSFQKNLVVNKPWDNAIISAPAMSNASTSCTAAPEISEFPRLVK